MVDHLGVNGADFRVNGASCLQKAGEFGGLYTEQAAHVPFHEGESLGSQLRLARGMPSIEIVHEAEECFVEQRVIDGEFAADRTGRRCLGGQNAQAIEKS